jgi:hypothetical protein
VGWPVREFRNRRRNARRGTTVASLAGAAWAAGLITRAALRTWRGTGKDDL